MELNVEAGDDPGENGQRLREAVVILCEAARRTGDTDLVVRLGPGEYDVRQPPEVFMASGVVRFYGSGGGIDDTVLRFS